MSSRQTWTRSPARYRSRKLINACALASAERWSSAATVPCGHELQQPDSRSCFGARFSGAFKPPEARIVDDEPRIIHAKISDEGAASAFVAVGRVAGTTVELINRLEGEAWESEPGCPHRGLGTDSQTE